MRCLRIVCRLVRRQMSCKRAWPLRCWTHDVLAALESRPGDPQLLHLVDQRSAFQAKFETHYADPQDAEAGDRPAGSPKRRERHGSSTAGATLFCTTSVV